MKRDELYKRINELKWLFFDSDDEMKRVCDGNHDDLLEECVEAYDNLLKAFNQYKEI